MRSLFKHPRAQAGFTLVELLVVIGIIALLIAVLLPSLSRVRRQSERTRCLANLRSLGQAMFLYANDYRDRLPNGNATGDGDPDFGDQVLVALSRDYATPPGTFHCPSDIDPVPMAILNNYIGVANSARVSYDFYSLYFEPEESQKLARLRGRAPLAWDLGVSTEPGTMQNHGTTGGNVVFADGHATWLDVKQWDATNWPAPAQQFYGLAAATASSP